MRGILVDTGPLLALFRERDPDHNRVRAFMRNNRKPMATTWPVLTEVCYMLNLKAKRAALEWVHRGGVELEALTTADAPALIAIFDRFGDHEVDLADASLVWLADRLGTTDILTFDEKDFAMYRTVAGKSFNSLLTP
jgi:uncharacterized protein